jgi:hypothetical protein
MSARKIALGIAAAALAGLWYLAVLDRPATHGAVDQAPNASTALPATAISSISSIEEQRPQAAAPALQNGEQLAAEGEPVLPESERIAIANAQKPIEQQAPEIQNQYNKAWLEGLERSRHTQQEMLERLQAEREKSTPEMRAFIDERIAQKQKTLQERESQIALYAAKVGPTQ